MKARFKAGASALVFLLSSVVAQCASAKDWTTIRIGVDPTYPPFESVAKDGSLVGFDIDLGNALCAKLNAKCEWVQTSFDGLIPGLKARKFDVILSSMAATAKRREQIDFSDRLYRNQTKLIVRRDSGLKPESASLAGRKVAVEQGTVQETYARTKWAPANVQVVSYQNYDQAYADLANGRVDGVLMDAVQGKIGFLETPRGQPFSFTGDALYDPVIMGDGDAAGVRKSDRDLLTALNGAIAQILRDGTYKRIERKYFDFDMYGK
ncbi:ABC transporter substrate-binding protein [Trinickia caryophylli]|uniref:Amino acid ABC transporter substrate-binding protein, PAAT family n=1 Tax=Trinickia caryophylli TaxID=28094 RepID=A0A1X7FT79_TRICW|nr:ABC transporter substrate-binding protein [Trinickia caryophylli]PMS11934.1 ABC transporter substrate-binding protein [Trinickia caryophylli]TRX13989.1 ABC transporter substrate-binding protein [Trinickia caryophylli]WQE15586.1 ABC transporter substrate-binding protein [Trinickia caryophylli]SMF58393.1 amino acid ABC transporter substrate-binding protein, PAAT family [Trinickia caryophylli]GLU33656.1 ABC transporter substrate-binding protein [Trinickia caryophylli]